MLESFFPDLIVDKIQDINLQDLKNRNIKGLLLDIDNTLVPMHIKEADENAIKWIERVKANGFNVCIVSNASKKRVIKFNEKLKLYAIHRASKPGISAFRKAMRLIDVKPEETAVVGDQIFTDIFGGNRIDLMTILVSPINKKESFFIKLKRFPEKFILSKYKQANKTK